jgi:4-oxalocrotonate tautomerase
MRIGHAEEMMPEVVVYLLEGRTLDAKRSLVKDITDAVVKNLGAPPEAVTVSLVETPKTAKGKAASCSAICRRALRPTRFTLSRLAL